MKAKEPSGNDGSDGPTVRLERQADTEQTKPKSYSPAQEFFKEHLKGWFDFITFFRQRRAIIDNPALMIKYPEDLNPEFKSPLKFSIQCLGFYLLVSYVITTIIPLFANPVDVANSANIKWVLATDAKIEGIIIPISIIVSSNIFVYVLFKKPKPLNPAVLHADIIHMTYIQAILFWPNTILSILINIKYYSVYYLTFYESIEQDKKLEDFDRSIHSAGLFLGLVLLVYLSELAKLFGTSKSRICLALWLSN